MNRPLVSIITPAFNPGRFLAAAVESIVAQTYREWELIVVDDGSAEPIELPGPADPRVRIVRQANRGQSAARNHGIMLSSGELVAFLDADDLWEAEKLERQVAALESRPQAVLCHTRTRFIDAQGRPGGLGWGGEYQTYQDLLDGCGVVISSVVIRRQVLFTCGLFDLLSPPAEDYDLWLKATRLGPMIAMSDPLVFYRLHDANESRNYPRTTRELLRILRRHLALARARGDAEIVRRCRRGISRTRRNAALQAVAALVGAVKGRQFGATFRHVRAGMTNAPATFMGTFIRRAFRRGSRSAAT
jgi:glycosyltransferase involved in cell wall biosynthesis